MDKKEITKMYNSIKRICEMKIALAAKIHQCIRCEKTFDDPEEFKILTNPITKEQKRSLLCNTCRPIVLAEFKKMMAERRKV